MTLANRRYDRHAGGTPGGQSGSRRTELHEQPADLPSEWRRGGGD